MSRSVPQYLMLSLVLLVLISAGCGSKGPILAAVKGSVSLKGEPVGSGTISFIPLENQGDAVGLPIVNGKYEVAMNRGLPPGKYRVELRWQKETGKMTKDPDNGDEVPVTTEGMPPEFHENSTLEVAIEEGENVKDFLQ
jgi:hypothetical protein